MGGGNQKKRAEGEERRQKGEGRWEDETEEVGKVEQEVGKEDRGGMKREDE